MLKKMESSLFNSRTRRPTSASSTFFNGFRQDLTKHKNTSFRNCQFLVNNDQALRANSLVTLPMGEVAFSRMV